MRVNMSLYLLSYLILLVREENITRYFSQSSNELNSRMVDCLFNEINEAERTLRILVTNDRVTIEFGIKAPINRG